MKIKGKYNEAEILIKDIDYYSNFAGINQVKALCDLEVLKGSKIRIMPDMCPAIGTTIGSTFTYNDKIIPSLVSGDIGCGITTVKLKEKKIEFPKVEKIIREQLLERKKIDSIVDKYASLSKLENLSCKKYVDIDRCLNKLADLGGGNHFIEIDKDEYGYLYITVHSGSRLLGQQIYDYYIDAGYKKINDRSYNRLYTYLEEDLLDNYLKDCLIATKFASLNRDAIIDVLVKFTKVKVVERIESIHNYVDTNRKIIRKGAISSEIGERLVIPISASPIYGGIILGEGLSNEDWNYSAPHGAGRICSRGESKDLFSLNQYKKEMEGVYSSSVTKETIDESPMVYKKIDFIMDNIKESVKVEEIIKPVFNYKTGNK